MHTVVPLLCLIVASVSAGHLGFGGYYANPAAHVPSGSIGVGPHNAVIAGPAGSVRTDFGRHGHPDGSVVAGPAGEIATRGGHTVITGPGKGHDAVGYAAAPLAYAAAPVSYAAAPVAYAAALPGVGAWGPAAGWIGAGWGHAGHGLLGHGW